MSAPTADALLRELLSRYVGTSERVLRRTRVEAAERRADVVAGLSTRIAELRRGLARAGFAEWRELVELLFPRAGGYSVAIWPDGRLALRGAVTVAWLARTS